MSGAVLDACVMQRYVNALVGDTQTTVTQLIDCLDNGVGFAVDDRDRIVHQWRETCGHALIEDWISQRIQSGALRMVATKTSARHSKHLRISLGFPYQQRHEGAYVEVASSAPPNILVSEDIDFWEPTAKARSSAEKEAIISGRRGNVCRYLLREMNVTVLTPSQAFDLLCGQAGPD